MHLMEGLRFLHSHQITHCDISAANVLVLPKTSSPGLRSVLSDFGQASCVMDTAFPTKPVLSSEITATLRLQTLPYRLPEVIAQDFSLGAHNLIDVWSVGCVCFECGGSRTLFPVEKARSEWELAVAMMKQFGSLAFSCFDDSPAACFRAPYGKPFLQAVLAPSPEHRPSAQHALDVSEFIDS